MIYKGKSKFFYRTYLYPKVRRYNFWGRIILTILAIILLIILPFYIPILIYKVINIPVIGVTFTVIACIFDTIIIGYLIKDCYVALTRLSTAYKPRARLYVTFDSLNVFIGNRNVESMKWKDADIIEKYNYYGEFVILLINNIMGEKRVKCSDRHRNFIMLPYRKDIMDAIERYSKRKVEIAPIDIDRFGRDY